MKNTLCFAIGLLLPGLMSAGVVLTGFGSGDFADQGSTGFSQTATTATYSGTDLAGSFLGTFTPVSIAGSQASLLLAATQTTAVSSVFTLQLYDGTLFQDYDGSWASFPQNSPSVVTLTMGAATPGFDFTQVQGVQILFGGSGATLAVQFDTLSTAAAAVPEPAACAALAATAALGAAGWRRRRGHYAAQ